MTTLPIHEVATKFFELVHRLKPGDEVIITENDQPVAKLIGPATPAKQPRRRGSAKGKLVIHLEDEEHLEDFKEYMP